MQNVHAYLRAFKGSEHELAGFVKLRHWISVTVHHATESITVLRKCSANCICTRPMNVRNDGMLARLFSCLLFLLFSSVSLADPGYKERLNLQPLTPLSLLASFHFWGNDTLQSYNQQHFRYIPRSLGQILQHSNTQELHLRFSSGRWDDESWGTRPRNGTKEGGTGVELWAWMEASSEEE